MGTMSWAPNVWRTYMATVSAIAPALIGVSNSTIYFGGMLYKDHAAVATCILEFSNLMVFVAQH